MHVGRSTAVKWLMRDDEAQSFIRVAQAALEYQKCQTQITIDDTVWIVGFVQGAPYRRICHTGSMSRALVGVHTGALLLPESCRHRVSPGILRVLGRTSLFKNNADSSGSPLAGGE